MSDEVRRSRFDLSEPAPARKSKFDRSRSRSRSPARENTEAPVRSRSPVAKDEAANPRPRIDPEEAKARALAAAAKINAAIAAGGIQHASAPRRVIPLPKASSESKDDVYQQNGDFIKDIEINDLRNRYTLTKGEVQKQIKEETGADVTTRGSYFPDKSMATLSNPPLYLRVTSTTRKSLDMAVAKIEELKTQELPNLIDERRFRRREPEFERDAMGRRKFPEAAVAIDLEPIPGFNLRATIVGSGGANVKHIQQSTGCRVQIKGRGSGFIETDTGAESDQAMYLHLSGTNEQLAHGKELAGDLINNIKQKYNDFKEGRVAQNAPSGDQESRYRRGQESHYRGGRGGRDYGGRNRTSNYVDSDDKGGRNVAVLDYDRIGGVNEESEYTGGYGRSDELRAEMNNQGTYGPTGFNPGAMPSGPPGPSGHSGSSGQGLSTAEIAAAAGMDEQTYLAWEAYYAANPQADSYAAHGGFTNYMRSLAAYNQQYANAAPYSQGFPGPADPGNTGAYSQAGYGGYGQGYADPAYSQYGPQSTAGYDAAQAPAPATSGPTYGYAAPGQATPGTADGTSQVATAPDV